MNDKDLKQLVIDYKTTFGSESGQRVLDDLKKRCSFETSTFVSNSQTTPQGLKHSDFAF